MKIETDIAILGAGPGGAATSLVLSKMGISHVVFDRANFPREKVCGDAVSGKSIALLDKIDPSYALEMADNKRDFIDSWGVTFVAPNGKKIEIPFKLKREGLKHPVGFVTKRVDFDNFLFQKMSAGKADVYAATTVKRVKRENGSVVISAQNKKGPVECRAKVVVGAEGDRSIVARSFAGYKMDPKHYCPAIRGYYENVKGMHPENFIELFYIKDLIPGYFWIFPLPGNRANVGLGMLSAHVRKHHVKLKDLMVNLVKTHPLLKDRFDQSTLVGDIQGWGIPMGSKKQTLSGDRYLLVGDAGSLVDPFSGEGIGNALVSGKIAAETLAEAVEENDFSLRFLKTYEKRVYEALWSELKLGRALQRLVRFPWLFNFVVNKAAKNETIRKTITCMFDDMDLRAQLKSPMFYLKLLFSR